MRPDPNRARRTRRGVRLPDRCTFFTRSTVDGGMQSPRTKVPLQCWLAEAGLTLNANEKTPKAAAVTQLRTDDFIAILQGARTKSPTPLAKKRFAILNATADFHDL